MSSEEDPPISTYNFEEEVYSDTSDESFSRSSPLELANDRLRSLSQPQPVRTGNGVRKKKTKRKKNKTRSR